MVQLVHVSASIARSTSRRTLSVSVLGPTLLVLCSAVVVNITERCGLAVYMQVRSLSPKQIGSALQRRRRQTLAHRQPDVSSTPGSKAVTRLLVRGGRDAEKRDAEGVEGVGNGEGVSPSPTD